MTTIAQDEKSFIHFRQNIKLINLTRFQVKPVTPSWIKILQRTFSLLVAKHIENSNWGKIFWKWLKFLSFHNILLYYIKVYYYKIYLSIYAMLCYANLTWAFCVAPWNKDWSLFCSGPKSWLCLRIYGSRNIFGTIHSIFWIFYIRFYTHKTGKKPRG